MAQNESGYKNEKMNHKKTMPYGFNQSSDAYNKCETTSRKTTTRKHKDEINSSLNDKL